MTTTTMDTDTPSPPPDARPAFHVTTSSSDGIPLIFPSVHDQTSTQAHYTLFKQPSSHPQLFAPSSTTYSASSSSSSSFTSSSGSNNGLRMPLFPTAFASGSSSASEEVPLELIISRLENTHNALKAKYHKGKARALSSSEDEQEVHSIIDADMDHDQDQPMHSPSRIRCDLEHDQSNASASGSLTLSLSSPPSSASIADPNNSLQAAQQAQSQSQGQGVISPPTPAPSPVPGRGRGGWWIPRGGDGDGTGRQGRKDGKGWEGEEDGMVDAEMAAALLASAGELGCDPTALLRAFPSLPAPTRLAFLNTLLPLLTTPELLMLSGHIGPRLKRDFLSDLPQELALHCLSFVDDPRTLARASCVSKHWRKLLEDEQTWKDMCERHRFQTNPVPTLPTHAVASVRPIPATGGAPGSPTLVTVSRAAQNGTDEIVIPSSTNQLQPVFGITGPQNFVASRVRRDSGLMETEEETGPTHGIYQGPAVLAPQAPPPPHLVPAGGVTSAAAQVALSGLTAAQIANPAVPAGFAQIPNGTITASTSTPNPLHMTGVTNGQLPPLPSVVSPGAQALSASISANRIRGNSLLGPAGRAFFPEPTSRPGRSRGGSSSSPHLLSKRQPGFSYRMHFKKSYLTESNWLRGGRLLSSHTSADDGVVTSLAVDSQHIIIGMANSKIHIFEAGNGTFLRTLSGHELGVWCLALITAGGGPLPDDDSLSMSSEDEEEMHAGSSHSGPSFNIGSFSPFGSSSSLNGLEKGTNRRLGKGMRAKRNRSGQIRRTSISTEAPVDGPSTSQRMSSANNATDRMPSLGSVLENITSGKNAAPTPAGSKARRMRQSDVCGAARGWGQKNSIVVSGGCDRDVKVWNLETGECLHTLHGHTSTIRCLKVIDGRPIVVSGSRDATLKVWDVEKGELVHSLQGHQHSVRCIEIAGNQVVSGSYDCTCRIWDLDTGECLQTLRGHYHQIYAVAFDGERVATGSLDSTVRIWSAATGECVALLQGHTSLVGQLQLIGDTLITGGSDGRVIIFDLVNYTCLQRICAHDNSVTCLQFDDRFIVSGGNDGRVKLWDIRTGNFIRELSKPCEAVWRVTFRDDKCAILCKRNGKTILEVLSFVPEEV